MTGDTFNTKLLMLSKAMAKNSWKVALDKDYLILTEAVVLSHNNELKIIGYGGELLKVYPQFTSIPRGFIFEGREGQFAVYKKLVTAVDIDTNIKTSFSLIEATSEKTTYSISVELNNLIENNLIKEVKVDLVEKKLHNIFLCISYEGDQARLYKGNEFIADNFYTGRVWEVALKSFNYPDTLRIESYPLRKKDEVFLEKWPKMVDGIACELSSIGIRKEYLTKLEF